MKNIDIILEEGEEIAESKEATEETDYVVSQAII